MDGWRKGPEREQPAHGGPLFGGASVRFLFLIPHPLVPSNRGNKIYSLSLLRELSRYHECDVLGFEEPNTHGDWASLASPGSGLRVLETFEQARGSALRAGRWRAIRSGLPWALARYESAPLRSYLRALDLSKYGAICFDMFLMAGYCDLASSRPTVLWSTDAYSMMLWRAAKTTPSVGPKVRFLAEAAVQARFERQVYPRFTRVVTVSQVDAAWISKVTGGRARVSVVEIPVEPLEPSNPAERAHDLVICWALLKSEGVASSVASFVRRGWPAVRARFPSAHLLLLGPSPPSFLRAEISRQPGVTQVDFVEDWRAVLHSASIFLYPQHCGSGQQTKVQSAMSMSLPLVIAPETATGLGLKHGDAALVCRDADECAEACIRLLENRTLRQSLGASARNHVLHHNAPKDLGRQMTSLLEEVAAR